TQHRSSARVRATRVRERPHSDSSDPRRRERRRRGSGTRPPRCRVAGKRRPRMGRAHRDIDPRLVCFDGQLQHHRPRRRPDRTGADFMDVSWIPGAAGSLYDIDNLPYGVISRPGSPPRVAVRVGDFALDIASVAAFCGEPADAPHLAEAWGSPSLNPFLALGREAWEIGREWLVDILTDDAYQVRVEPHLHRLGDVRTHLPIEVGDYVDFYASIDHATNLGRIMRPDSAPLLPNWRHLPVGYHGRSGTIIESGTPIVRPSGQRRGDDGPTFGPSERLDIEAELGFVVGAPSSMGTPVATDAFPDHVFGAFLLNDWSARDI